MRRVLSLLVVLMAPLSAWAQTLWYTPQQFGAVCDGGSHPLSGLYGSLGAAQAVYPFVTSLTQQIDFAALQKMSNTALGAPGSEHGASNPQLNVPMYIPGGICNLGADTWKMSKSSGIQIVGAGSTATQIKGSGIVLQFDGLWYSHIADMSIVATSSAPAAVLDIDGNAAGPGTTFGVQGNRFDGLLVGAAGGQYGVALCRQGSSNGQCSENTFDNFHGSGVRESGGVCGSGGNCAAVYYQNGFNALDNVMIGGDFQDYDAFAVYLVAGSLKIIGTSFESLAQYHQIANGGCDISANSAGANDSIEVIGSRSESQCFYAGNWPQKADIRGFTHAPRSEGWSAGHTYVLNDSAIKTAPGNGRSYLYVVTTAGVSGGGEPTWPTSGTVSDGGVVWTNTSYLVVNVNEGYFDTKASYIDPSASIIAGWQPTVSNCGSGGSVFNSNNGSTRYRGSATMGSAATGCWVAIRFPVSVDYPGQSGAPVCTVSQQSGTPITGYSVALDTDPFWGANTWELKVAGGAASAVFSWQCSQ